MQKFRYNTDLLLQFLIVFSCVSPLMFSVGVETQTFYDKHTPKECSISCDEIVSYYKNLITYGDIAPNEKPSSFPMNFQNSTALNVPLSASNLETPVLVYSFNRHALLPYSINAPPPLITA